MLSTLNPTERSPLVPEATKLEGCDGAVLDGDLHAQARALGLEKSTKDCIKQMVHDALSGMKCQSQVNRSRV